VKLISKKRGDLAAGQGLKKEPNPWGGGNPKGQFRTSKSNIKMQDEKRKKRRKGSKSMKA